MATIYSPSFMPHTRTIVAGGPRHPLSYRSRLESLRCEMMFFSSFLIPFLCDYYFSFFRLRSSTPISQWRCSHNGWLTLFSLNIGSHFDNTSSQLTCSNFYGASMARMKKCNNSRLRLIRCIIRSVNFFTIYPFISLCQKCHLTDNLLFKKVMRCY